MNADRRPASCPRYSTRPFPPYAFEPGKTPHPRHDPHGHSYGLPEPAALAFQPGDWQSSEPYRYAIDLYNFGYWWECHEVFEGLWRAVGTKTEQGNCFQALIDLAAGNLKLRMGAMHSAILLWQHGVSRLERLPSSYMGLDVPAIARAARGALIQPTGPLVPILLRP